MCLNKRLSIMDAVGFKLLQKANLPVIEGYEFYLSDTFFKPPRKIEIYEREYGNTLYHFVQVETDVIQADDTSNYKGLHFYDYQQVKSVVGDYLLLYVYCKNAVGDFKGQIACSYFAPFLITKKRKLQAQYKYMFFAVGAVITDKPKLGVNLFGDFNAILKFYYVFTNKNKLPVLKDTPLYDDYRLTFLWKSPIINLENNYKVLKEWEIEVRSLTDEVYIGDMEKLYKKKAFNEIFPVKEVGYVLFNK